MTQTDRIELVRTVFQGIIASIIILGGGFLMYVHPADSAVPAGTIGAVVSYYFLSATQSHAVNSTLRSVQSQMQLVQTATGTGTPKASAPLDMKADRK